MLAKAQERTSRKFTATRIVPPVVAANGVPTPAPPAAFVPGVGTGPRKRSRRRSSAANMGGVPGVTPGAAAGAASRRSRRKSMRVQVHGTGAAAALAGQTTAPVAPPVVVAAPGLAQVALPKGMPPPVSAAVANMIAEFPAARAVVMVMGDLNYRVKVDPQDAVGLICQAAKKQKVRVRCRALAV